MNGTAVYIVIPNYNGQIHLKDCFDSLLRQTFSDFKVLLIDNNSSDESISFTTKGYPQVETIRMSYNTGFAKAVNAGIKRALEDDRCNYVILLNNDTDCDARFVEEMVKSVSENDAGSGACKMLNFTDRTVIDDAGDFIKRRGSPYARGFGEKDIKQYDNEEFIFGACAGAAIYRTEVFEKAGYFDDDFFAYYEDVDFSFRLQLMGYKCFYNPKAVCYHKRGATTAASAGFQTYYCEKNLVALRIKNYPSGMYLLSIPFFFIVRLKRYLNFLFHHSPSIFASAVKGYFKGLSELPLSFKKRQEIMKNVKVSDDYIKNILR
ncbi:MAG: glycosyltransferase family 2 protein [Ignavibacteria bacterium]|nr:glycosyltransferase family 2 protein [Ignavibacteria bacterium]